jgi:hypothetical protein
LRARAAALAAALLTLHCVVYAQHPLRGELPRILDPALAGEWRRLAPAGEPESQEPPVAFSSHGDHYLVHGEQGEPLEATTARLEGVRYLNFATIGGESPDRVVIVRYEILDGRLRLAPMSFAVARDLVEKGELHGAFVGRSERAMPEDDARTLLLTASSAELEDYLRAHGPDTLFPKSELLWARPGEGGARN